MVSDVSREPTASNATRQTAGTTFWSIRLALMLTGNSDLKFRGEFRLARLLAVLTVVALLAGCGSSPAVESGVGDAPPDAAQVESMNVSWSQSDDPADVIAQFEAAGIPLDTVSPDGELIDSYDVVDCLLEDVQPLGPYMPGDNVTIEIDCRQRDWDRQEGDVWDEFALAYAAGFDDGCSAVFSDLSPDGYLYADDFEYSDLDCSIGSEFDAPEATGLPSDVPDSPAQVGSELGAYDGCVRIFDDAGGYLSYGSQEFDSSYCGVDI